MRALYETFSDFRFAFYREDFLTRVGKFFGMRDVQTGNPLLDRDYLVRTNDEELIRSLVASSHIPELLAQQPDGVFQLAKFRGRWRNRPENVAELLWQTTSVITEAHRLGLLVQTFRDTLDRLARINVAREGAVDYKL